LFELLADAVGEAHSRAASRVATGGVRTGAGKVAAIIRCDVRDPSKRAQREIRSERAADPVEARSLEGTDVEAARRPAIAETAIHPALRLALQAAALGGVDRSRRAAVPGARARAHFDE